MQPVRASILIDRPREQVFEYLVDIANHPEFLDHFMKDWRLTRLDSHGSGAGARFRIAAPRRRFSWADLSFAEVDPPYRILAVGRGGKFNRVKLYAEWVLQPSGRGTRVEAMFETEPPLPTDRLFEPLGSRGWFKRKLARALRRLQSILEDGEERGTRATVSGVLQPSVPASG